MIDWLSLILPSDVRIKGGRNIRLTPDGEIDFEKDVPYMLKGSYDTGVQLCNIPKYRSDRGKSIDMTFYADSYVYISGNPSKYLQGHNVYGTNDLKTLVAAWLLQIALDLNLPLLVAYDWEHLAITGNYEITRIDITENFRVGKTSDDVSRWLHEAHKTARVSHKSASILKGDTFYFGKHSRRHTIKLYNKYTELTAHGVDPKLLEYRDRIMEDAEGLLRIESCYRAKKLRDLGIEKASDFDRLELRIFDMYKKDLESIQISAQQVTNEINIDTVGAGAYGAYRMWADGVMVKHMLPKNTFYRYRRLLLPLGVDLTIPPVEPTNTVKLKRIIIEDIKVELTPSWYYDNNLIAA